MDEHSSMLAKVLLVDDNQAEIVLATHFLRRECVHLNLSSLQDGTKVIDHLLKQVSESTLPDLVLLDINMPTMNGKVVLSKMMRDSTLKDIPVFMCSGSDAPSDEEESKNLGALGYIVKPLTYDKLSDAVSKVDQLQFLEEKDEKYLYRVNSDNS